MRTFTQRILGVARLAAIASLVVAIGGCQSDKKSGGGGLTATHSISGTISGDVLAGVTVAIQGGSRKAISDSLGRYTIAGLTDGSYTLVPSLTGYGFTPATLDATVSGANVTGKDFTAVAGIGIFGKVTGEAASGVTITLQGPLPAATTVTTTTDANGNYVFPDLATGDYLVTPSLAGGWTFSPANSQVKVVDASVAGPDFAAIAPTHTLSGKVTGAIVAGIVVTLSGPINGATVTDASGNYSFSGLGSGSYTVTPAREGYVFTPTDINATIGTTDLTGQDFQTVATHKISGRVSGDVVAGVEVSVTGNATLGTTTDAAGYFEFAGLLSGTYVVKASLDGYTFTPPFKPVTLSAADVTDANFTSAAVPTWSVSGAVSGDVLAGVTMTLQTPTPAVTTTDGTGAFSFQGVPDGDYSLTPSNPDYLFTPASRVVSVSGGNVTAQTFTAVLSPTARTISGAVSGELSAGVTVTLQGPSPAATTVTATTDAAGSFAFRGLTDGTYLATPTFAGYGFTPANCLVTVAGPSVTSVQFVAASLPHTISGKVTGAVLANVTVDLGGDATLTTQTAADGSYSFPGLAKGDYTVTPSLPGYLFGPAAATVTLQNADATGVDFVAVATHRIAGAITGDPTDGVRVVLSGAASAELSTDATGLFEFTDLTDGDYVLTVSLDGYTFDPIFVPITVSGADVTGVFFDATLIPTYTVSGTITGPGGAGAGVSLSGAKADATTADGAGAYSFTGVPDGSYMVIPSQPGFVYTPAARAFRVNGANVTGQDFTGAVAP
jgi:uncharacterized surface anchored protein